MATHTYVVNPLSPVPSGGTDIMWTCTGTADGLPFSVTFWQSAIANLTLAQLKTFVKGLIDAQVFPTTVAPSGVLASFQGGTFTQ